VGGRNDGTTMTNIVHRLVAMSLSAMWHLDAMLERSVVGLLTSAPCRLCVLAIV